MIALLLVRTMYLLFLYLNPSVPTLEGSQRTRFLEAQVVTRASGKTAEQWKRRTPLHRSIESPWKLRLNQHLSVLESILVEWTHFGT